MTKRLKVPTRSSWLTVFGTVPDHGLQRRASDIAKVVFGLLLALVGAVASHTYDKFEKAVQDLVAALPDPVIQTAKFVNGGGIVAAIVVIALVAISSRRPRFIGKVLLAVGISAALTIWLQHIIDAPAAVDAASKGLHDYPQYPGIRLVVAAAAFFVAGPEMTRPSRRLLKVLLVLIAVSVLGLHDGYPSGIIGSLALGWAIAAAIHLALGSPDGMPDPQEIEQDLSALGFDVGTLTASPVQVWGQKAFDSVVDGTRNRVIVIGRDATDAELFTKLGRSIWMKDSGPTLGLTRTQQIEHQAFAILMAERGGVDVPSIALVGEIGARRDSVLVLSSDRTRSLASSESGSVTDQVVDSCWKELAELHAARLSHGSISGDTITVGDDGSVGFIDLAMSRVNPDATTQRVDRAAMLVVTADSVGVDRAVDRARAALGDEELEAVLPLVQTSALSRLSRRSVDKVRSLCSQLRSRAAEVTGTEAPKVVELHRVSIANILIAAFTILGVYLLIGELSHVEWSTVFSDARWGWVIATAIVAQTPIFALSIAKLGSVAQPLPLGPVVMLDVGTKFTGLAGGGVTTMALEVRFFQKQGMKAAVAVTSSLLNSVASGLVEVLLLVFGLIVGISSFSLKRGGNSSGHGGGGLAGWIYLAAIVVAVSLAVTLLVPTLRRRLGGLIMPQVRSAWSELSTVMRTPKKGLQLLGGNLVSQVLYACALWTALHAYGASLGLPQLIIINTFASVLGGIAPVPGGIGVIEAGLIAGFTAAGVPDQAAIAATFTARMFTAYLPPVAGWMAIAWMRRRDYV